MNPWEGNGRPTRWHAAAPACGVTAHPTFQTPGEVRGAERASETRTGAGPRAPGAELAEASIPGGGDSAGWVVSTSPTPARNPRTLLQHRLDPVPAGDASLGPPPITRGCEWTEGLSTRAREPAAPALCPFSWVLSQGRLRGTPDPSAPLRRLHACAQDGQAACLGQF